ncbi:MAG: hypothetical protein V2A61_08035, partial [Calditrichota bacterium]
MKLKSLTLLTLGICVALANLGFARILNVPGDFNTIQAAVNAAQNTDTILVAEGVYEENLIIRGTSLSLIGDRDHPEQVVIDGSNGGSVILFTGLCSEPWLIAGFTLRNGTGSLSGNSTWGGALSIRGTIESFEPPQIEDCVFLGNTAVCGSAIFSSGAVPSIYRSVFRDNHAT